MSDAQVGPENEMQTQWLNDDNDYEQLQASLFGREGVQDNTENDFAKKTRAPTTMSVYELAGDFDPPPAVIRAKEPRPTFETRLGDSIVEFFNKV